MPNGCPKGQHKDKDGNCVDIVTLKSEDTLAIDNDSTTVTPYGDHFIDPGKYKIDTSGLETMTSSDGKTHLETGQKLEYNRAKRTIVKANQ